MHIRPAKTADIPSVLSLERDAVTASHWSPQQYESAANSSDRIMLLIEHANLIQGFVVARAIDREWEIENIAVASVAQRQGLGSRLLTEILELARLRGAQKIFLEVRESNHAARALYEKYGFVLVGRRTGYYHNPHENAVTYRRPLT